MIKQYFILQNPFALPFSFVGARTMYLFGELGAITTFFSWLLSVSSGERHSVKS
jgi:hypothetical protein